MPEKPGEIGGIFVQGPGTGRSIVAGAAGGVLASAAAERLGRSQGEGPLGAGQLGYLSVSPDQVILYGAKRKTLMGGFKATDDVLVALARADVATASFEKGKLLGRLQVTFTDNSGWVFEVPKVGNKTVDEAVAALAGAA
jgi:hypothetical protein